jgi:hypothetical protein
MAGPHPVKIHPARPLYRFAATGLGASMWFFVRLPNYVTSLWLIILQLMYRAKKDGRFSVNSTVRH